MLFGSMCCLIPELTFQMTLFHLVSNKNAAWRTERNY